MPSIRLIDAERCCATAFLPSEREHNELNTLLRALPDGVISIDAKGAFM